MNILKTPRQKILEEAGAVPSTPGMLKTPQQLLFEESGAMPNVYADGGTVNAPRSVDDMLAELVAMGYQPQRFDNGGAVENINRSLGTNYKPTYNPEATIGPQDRSSYTLSTRDKIAEILTRLTKNESWGEKTADELFGTGSGGMEPWVGTNIPSNLAKGAVQMFNPVSVATDIMDLPKRAVETTRAEGPIAGGLEVSLTGLGALPYVGSSLKQLKKLGSKLSKKTKE